MEPVPTGFLVINVLEAAGHDSNDAGVWEPDFKEGYARGEAASSACLTAPCGHSPQA